MHPFLFRRFRNLETKVHELNYLFWECTQRCNLSCRHCGSDCFASAKDRDMPLEDFLKALDTIPNPHLSGQQKKKKAGQNLIVVLTGGEPLLRPDIEQIGQEIKKRGYWWSMVSNGFFYTEEMHKKLIRAGLKALTFSLDGIEDTHNWMRGNPKSYEHTVKAIEIAAKEKYLDLDVVSCVNRRNINHLEEIYQKLSSLGVRKWRLFTIIPIGRAKEDPDMHLTNQEMVRLMDFIVQKRQTKHSLPSSNSQTSGNNASETGSNSQNSGKQALLDVAFSCEGYLGRYEEKVRPVRFFCHAGINIASVLIDGRICACPNIDRDVFSQGNIYQDNLYEVWENKFQVFRNRNWAKKGICARCPQFKNCLGGGMHNWHDGPLSCHYRRTGG
ncbi:MAG: radical SAM protein [Bacteroidales bacterium]|nr:radical SAM protein [Bacteroidales bacterium]